MGPVYRGLARFSLLAALCYSPILTTAQDPEVSQRESTITFSTGVNLVPVRVVVRDKDGHTVGDLEQADFELKDNGDVQNIVRFSVDEATGLVPRAAAVPVDANGVERPDLQPPAARDPQAIPENFVAYVFDDVHTKFGDLAQVREAALKHMDEALDPSTRAAVFTISGQTRIDFTDDLDLIRETINKIRVWSADDGSNDCPPINYYWADLIINRSDQQAWGAAVDATMQCMSLPPDQRDVAEQVAKSSAIMHIAQGQRESRLGLGSLSDVVHRMAAMPGSRTIVYLSSGFYLDRDLRFPEQDLMNLAIKSRVVINSMDARGLYTIVPGGDASTMGKNTASQNIFQQRILSEVALATTNVMAELAQATGGTFVHNDNGYLAGLRRLAGAPEFTYVLSFAPSDLKPDGKFHKLKITLRDGKGLSVSARSGYYAPTEEQDTAETVREEIRDAVFSRAEMADLPMDVSFQYFKPSDLEAKLTVLAKLDISGLGFRKAEDRNNDVVTVVSAVFDRNGNFIKGVQRVIDMKLRDQTLDKLLSQGGISVRSTLDLDPGSYLVRVVVRDAEGKTMAARNGSVEIPY